MAIGSGPRPEFGLILVGTVLLGSSAARIAIAWNPGPGWRLFEAVNWLVGAALVLWGWFQLRRAKAAQLGVSWRQFLRADLIGFGIAVALMGTLAAMPPPVRDEVMRSLREFAHQLHIARGGP